MEQLTSSVDEFDNADVGDVKYKLRHFKTFKILLLITTFFIVLSIVFIILFGVKNSQVSQKTEESPSPAIVVQQYCGTKHCLWNSLGKTVVSLLSLCSGTFVNLCLPSILTLRAPV